MQNKENTCLTHFGRLRKKADRITAAAILSSTFTISYACGNNNDDKANTSELESKLAKAEKDAKEAKDKEAALNSQISTLEEAKATLEVEKTTLEGEKTTKTTAITNLIGLVNALGGKVATGLPVANMAGLHARTISESDCSTAHTATGSLEAIYAELKLCNPAIVASDLSALRTAIDVFYKKTNINFDYTSGSSTLIKALSAPTIGTISSTNVADILTYIEGLISHLKTEKTTAENQKNAVEAEKTVLDDALKSIEQELQIGTARQIPSDRVTDCKNKITNLRNSGGKTYTTVVTDINTLLGSSITIDPDETANKTAFNAYVTDLKAVYDKVPESGSAATPKEKKEAYLTALKAELNKIIDLYKATTDTTNRSNVGLTDPSLILSDTIVKLVTTNTGLRQSLEYLYNNILGVTDGSAKTLDVIVAELNTETTTKSIDKIKEKTIDLLDNLSKNGADTKLLEIPSSLGNNYTKDNIPMLYMSGFLDKVSKDAPFYKLAEIIITSAGKLTNAESNIIIANMTALIAPTTLSTEMQNLGTALGALITNNNDTTKLALGQAFLKCNNNEKFEFANQLAIFQSGPQNYLVDETLDLLISKSNPTAAAAKTAADDIKDFVDVNNIFEDQAKAQNAANALVTYFTNIQVIVGGGNSKANLTALKNALKACSVKDRQKLIEIFKEKMIGVVPTV